MSFTLAEVLGRPVCRKDPHASEGAAWAAVRSLERRGLDRPERGTLRPYYCRYCAAWHTGHEPGTGETVQEIIIEIDKAGNATVEGKGFVGLECTQLTKELEENLGEVTKREMKPEARQTRTATHKVGGGR